MIQTAAIVGRGTAGCIAYLNLLSMPFPIDIHWYYDDKINTSSVGEGTTPMFTFLLSELGDKDLASSDNLHLIDARPKIGIEYINWGKSNFVHPFGVGNHGIHFNASKFQQHIFNNYTNLPNVELLNTNVKSEELKYQGYQVVVDATGYPKELNEDYRIPKYISVNAVHVTQCDWPEEPKWLHTKTIARPWGWVFVIPLTSRCSVGYLYNRDISTLDQVKEDVENVIDELGVTPNGVTNSFEFNNYVKEKLIDDNVFYVGNSGFFLEPMEATTLDSISRVLEYLGEVNENSNEELHKFFKEVEYFIMMHYAAGSKWNNEFWDFATERGRLAMEEASKDSLYSSLFNCEVSQSYQQYFTPYSYRSNLKGLGLDVAA